MYQVHTGFSSSSDLDVRFPKLWVSRLHISCSEVDPYPRFKYEWICTFILVTILINPLPLSSESPSYQSETPALATIYPFRYSRLDTCSLQTTLPLLSIKIQLDNGFQQNPLPLIPGRSSPHSHTYMGYVSLVRASIPQERYHSSYWDSRSLDRRPDCNILGNRILFPIPPLSLHLTRRLRHGPPCSRRPHCWSRPLARYQTRELLDRRDGWKLEQQEWVEYRGEKVLCDVKDCLGFRCY